MKSNRTVARAISMLELISNYHEGLSLNEICEIMQIPKSSCFDILHTLVDANMIKPTGRDGKIYTIGVKAFIIGNEYMRNKQIMDISRNRMEKIGDKYAKSVFLGEDMLEHVVYVYKYQPKTSTVIASCNVGTKNEYYNTALGKCMLAFRDDYLNLIDKYVSEGEILDKDSFVKQIEQIKECKYVCSDQEHQKQLFCIAVPIFDHKGVVSSAISLAGLYSNKQTCTKEINELKNIAKEISVEIGYIGEY